MDCKDKLKNIQTKWKEYPQEKKNTIYKYGLTALAGIIIGSLLHKKVK